MRYFICTHCNAIISYETFCPSCHTSLNRATIKQVNLCPHDGTPVPVRSQLCTTCGSRLGRWYIPFWAWWCIVFIFGLLVTSLLIFLHHSLVTKYQQVSCVLENTAVTTSSTKNGTSYFLDFTYTVVGKQGQQVANGEDNMGLEGSFSSQDDAQQALDRYQIGSTHPCWYSPLAYPHVLHLKPDEGNTSLGWATAWLFGTIVVLILARWCIVRWIVAPWRISKYGVKASGTVVDHEAFKGRVTTTIEFQTQTEPPLTCRT